MPYRSRFGSGSKNFTDLASYRENNCVATNTTNGQNLYDIAVNDYADNPGSVAYYQQQPSVSIKDARQHALNVIMDGTPLSDINLPEQLEPTLPPLNESYSVAQFYMLDDERTGVLALGSFSAKNFTSFGSSLIAGLLELKARGASRLIVDVVSSVSVYFLQQARLSFSCLDHQTNNGGGMLLFLSFGALRGHLTFSQVIFVWHM